MDGPHLGVVLPNYGEAFDPGRLTAAAAAAEAAGLDSGWMTDHVLPPSRHAGIYGTIAEALVAVGYLAGCTTRLRLGVSALIVPQREPLLTLKQLVTLDVLSGGRLVTAVAAGWMEEEFRTLGASFPDRGRRLDEWLDLVGDLLQQAPGRVVADGPVPIVGRLAGPGADPARGPGAVGGRGVAAHPAPGGQDRGVAPGGAAAARAPDDGGRLPGRGPRGPGGAAAGRHRPGPARGGGHRRPGPAHGGRARPLGGRAAQRLPGGGRRRVRGRPRPRHRRPGGAHRRLRRRGRPDAAHDDARSRPSADDR